MRAWQAHRYGSPDRLVLEDVPVPQPAEGQVLVEVRAASVNALDWHLLRARPHLARLGEGLRRPRQPARGVDAAGVVTAKGPGVEHLAVGDRVVGSRTGAFGEYVAGRNFVAMPDHLGFADAAALPTAGLTALQGLRDKAELQAGERVLVHGAGGGVGSYAVQIARALGAEVTAATRTSSIELVRDLGATRVIDYAAEDPLGGTYDVILDAGGTRRLRDLRRAVRDGGRIALAAPAPGDWLAPVLRILGSALSRRTARPAIPYLAQITTADLATLLGLVADGSVRSVIDTVFPFDQVPDAIRRMEAGGVRGKIVVER